MTHESLDPIALLRRRLARIGRPRAIGAAGRCALGLPAIDDALGGGLARGCLHEVFAGEVDDSASAAGFTAMLARRFGGSLVWLRLADAQRRGGLLHAHGLVEIGCDPSRLILAVLPDALALLRAAADVARCGEVGVAVIELWGTPRPLDLTVSRRLAIAAEASGVPLLMLRIDAEPTASAAHSRWRVRAAPALPLAANAPGQPALDIELIRQRGGAAGGAWRVEWNRDLGCFEDPAVSGAVLPVPAREQAGGGQDGSGPRRQRA